jgi:hypothetical protein
MAQEPSNERLQSERKCTRRILGIFDIDEEIEDLQTQLTCRSKAYFDSTFSQWRLSNKLQTDDELCEAFVTRLKEEFTRVYALACEANTIAAEMQRHVIYSVMLQTPVVYLKPNERVRWLWSTESQRLVVAAFSDDRSFV